MTARSRFARLSSLDHMLFATEKPRRPQHIGGLCLVEAKTLLDAEGRLDIETIKRRLVHPGNMPERPPDGSWRC